MRKSSFVLAAAALAASSLMGARAEEVTLQFLFPSGNNGLEAAVAEFQKRNPDIKIQYQPIPFAQMNSQVLSRLGTQDSSLDIYGVDAPRVAALVQRKFLTDFSSLKSEALAAFGQKPVETATTVRYGGAENLIIDGTYADTKEVLGGYFVFDASDLDEVLEVAQRIPAVRLGGAVEVRPLVESHVESAH